MGNSRIWWCACLRCVRRSSSLVADSCAGIVWFGGDDDVSVGRNGAQDFVVDLDDVYLYGRRRRCATRRNHWPRRFDPEEFRSPFPRRHPPKSFTSPLVSGTTDNEHSIFAKVRLVRWFCLMLHVWLIALVVNSRRSSRGQRTSNHTVGDQI